MLCLFHSSFCVVTVYNSETPAASTLGKLKLLPGIEAIMHNLENTANEVNKLRQEGNEKV